MLSTKAYVTFGGNGKRKGLGYLLASEGGWLAKAGYAPERIAAFLSDVEKLSQHLGLIAIGVHRKTQQHVNLARMKSLAASHAGRSELQELHVRFYTTADFQQRWSSHFQWAAPVTAQVSTEPLLDLIDAMEKKNVTRRALAVGIGQDPPHYPHRGMVGRGWRGNATQPPLTQTRHEEDDSIAFQDLKEQDFALRIVSVEAIGVDHLHEHRLPISSLVRFARRG